MDTSLDTTPYQIQINDQPATVVEAKQMDLQRDRVFRLKVTSAVNLPETIVVKQKRENDEAEEFQCEKRAYERLQELQGKVIPELLGEGLFNGVPALFLSEVDGRNLYEVARDTDLNINMEALEAELDLSLEALTKKGGIYWDQRLDNFILCKNGKVTIIDLEQVTFPEVFKPWETDLNSAGVSSLMSRFRDTRDPNRPSSPVALWYSMETTDSIPVISRASA